MLPRFHAVPIVFCLLLLLPIGCSGSVEDLASPAATDLGDWRVYGGDKANTKSSPLDRIHRGNVGELEIAWTWSSLENEILMPEGGPRRFVYESTPLAVDGTLYVTTTLSQVAALDGATGETLWTFDPEAWKADPSHGLYIHRGASLWESGDERRLVVGTVDGRLLELDPDTGTPIEGFGDGGFVDLTKGLRREVERGVYSVSSPPVIVGDVIVVGASITDKDPTKKRAPGDVRGFDVRTGEQLWVFHTIPQPGELGHETWEDGSWEHTGNTNVWTVMSADEELGYVYLPVSTPTNDWYGGHRPGDNLFAESLVCLDAKTGERVWHFQMVRHGVWDYDLPAAPNLVDIEVDGRPIKAVAQVSKQGWAYVFDRVTGEPVWPIEDREVPASTVPGEKTAATQPYPTRPAPFDRQGVTESDLIDFTPELRAKALEILADFDRGPLFTPPTERGLIYAPGALGGANWTGAAFDRETGILYVPSITWPTVVKIVRPPEVKDTDVRYEWEFVTLDGPEGLPLVKPPYGRITAIDLNTGNHVWMSSLGEGPRDHPALRELQLARLGWPLRGAPLLTADLLFIGQEARHWKYLVDLVGGESLSAEDVEEAYRFDPYFRAFDKATGEQVWQMELPRNVTGAPMTYLVDDEQYIAFATGGFATDAELIALRLSSPD